MKTLILAGLRWRRIVSAAIAAFLGSMLVTILIVTGYAPQRGRRAARQSCD